MTKESIDIFFNYYANQDWESIITLLTDETLKTKILDCLLESPYAFVNDTIQTQVFANLMQQINSSNQLEYLEQTCLDNSFFHDIFVDFVTTSTISVDKAKQYVSKISSTILQKKLIVATHDIDYMSQCVEGGLLPQYKLIIEKSNTEELKQYIEEQSHILFGDSQMDELLIATNDQNYIKQKLQDPYFYSIGSKYRLMRLFQNPDDIEEFITNDSYPLNAKQKSSLIKGSQNPEYIKSKIDDESLELTHKHIISLIKSTRDSQYIRQKLENTSTDFSTDEIVELIKATRDLTYMQTCISDNPFELYTSQIVELIKATKYITDKTDGFDFNEYVSSCLQDDSLMLSEIHKSKLILATRNSEAIKNRFEYTGSRKTINLPQNMTIGIEIEAEGIETTQPIFDEWNAKQDSSVPTGVEIVSPILTPSDKDTQNIYTICNMLQQLQCITTDACGGHIHIGVNYLTSPQSFINLLELWGNSEKLIYIISNPPGEIIREEAVTSMAQPTSKKFEDKLSEGTINLENEDDLKQFIAGFNRYSGINLASIKKHNTIEFRVSNGTISPNTWIENINLFGSIIKAAEQLTQIQQKEEDTLTEEEQKTLQTFEFLKSKDIDEKQRLNALLYLTVGENQKAIYEERYEINSKLLHDKHPELENKIISGTSKNPIIVKKEDIKHAVFDRPNTVTSTKTEEARNAMNRHMHEISREENTNEQPNLN